MGASVIVIIAIVIAAALFAGSFRVEVDPLAPRPRRRVVNELLGVGILAAVIVSVAFENHRFPGAHPIAKGPAIIWGGVIFVLMAILLIASYFVPNHNTIFRLMSSWFENGPGNTGGRSGLLFVGCVFGLVGLSLLVAGSGILG